MLRSRPGRAAPAWPPPRLAAVAVVAGIALSAGMLTLKLGLGAEPLSRGPIVAITSANSLLVAALAAVFLHERLQRGLWLALAVIVAGLAVLALHRSSAAGWRAILFGLAAMALFGITNFLLKFAASRGARPQAAITVLWLASGACGCLALILCQVSGRGLAGLESPGLKALAFAAGLSLGLGMLSIKVALTRGPAGPVAAVAGANAVLVTLLDFLLLKQEPPAAKLLGMALVVSGILAMALIRHDPRGQ